MASPRSGHAFSSSLAPQAFRTTPVTSLRFVPGRATRPLGARLLTFDVRLRSTGRSRWALTGPSTVALLALRAPATATRPLIPAPNASECTSGLTARATDARLTEPWHTVVLAPALSCRAV